MRPFLITGAALTALCACLPACEGDVHEQIHGHIHVVINRDDALVPPALAALVKHRERALPQIETALHAARPQGRLRLVEALGRIDHPESVALLGHLALFDAEARVRELSSVTLARWTEGGEAKLKNAASAALETLRQARRQGLGPLVRED